MALLPEAVTSQSNIDFASSSSPISLPGNRRRIRRDADTCMHATRCAASKGRRDFPMQIVKGARPTKITVGNNVIDWEDALARARARKRIARNGQYIVGPAITGDH